MKTRVCLKYPLNDCRPRHKWTQMYNNGYTCQARANQHLKIMKLQKFFHQIWLLQILNLCETRHRVLIDQGNVRY